MGNHDIYYENIMKYPKLKPLDLAAVHIFEGKEQKPYFINKRNELVYLQIFKAVDKSSDVIKTVLAYDMTEGRRMLEEQIKTGTQRHKKWAEYGFTISRHPYNEAKRQVSLQFLSEDESIKDAKRYFDDICEQYERFFSKR